MELQEQNTTPVHPAAPTVPPAEMPAPVVETVAAPATSSVPATDSLVTLTPAPIIAQAENPAVAQTPIFNVPQVSHTRRNILFATLGVVSIIVAGYFLYQKYGVTSKPVVTATMVATTTAPLGVAPTNDDCINTFRKTNIPTDCIHSLPWQEDSTSTKDGLSASISYFMIANPPIGAGVEKVLIHNGNTTKYVSYAPYDADDFGNGSLSVYDFDTNYIYLAHDTGNSVNGGSSWIEYRNFLDNSSSTSLLYVNDNNNSFIYDYSTTTVNIYTASSTGFVKTVTYTLPKDMQDVGYIIGYHCWGDPCSDDAKTVVSFDGTNAVFNTHRYVNGVYTCPVAREDIVIGSEFSDTDSAGKNKCLTGVALAEGEGVILGGSRVDGISPNKNKKTEDVAVSNIFISGRTIPVKIK
jgi:hypothetical protein